MDRRALLASLTSGIPAFAGCNTETTPNETPATPTDTAGTDGSQDTRRNVFNPTGMAKLRPIDEPFLRQGLTADTGQYLYARSLEPGDSLPVTDAPGAESFAEEVAELSGNQFAILTSVRTGISAPAYFWPSDALWDGDILQIQLTRQTIGGGEAETQVMLTDSDAAEAVGTAITTYEYDATPPARIAVVFPSGATFQVAGVE